jgi:hypothetical protein
MTVNTLYTLSGNGTSITYGTESDTLDLTLDDSYAPFDTTHRVPTSDVTTMPTDRGIALTAALHHQVAGRGGPIEKTRTFALFLPDAPVPGDTAVENDATGAFVFVDPEPHGEVAPAYRAESLTGTVSVPAREPAGRF